MSQLPHSLRLFSLLALSSLTWGCAGAPQPQGKAIEYLEIVTPDVAGTCKALSAIHGVTFAAPDPALGNAQTADLANGGRIGVRAPMAAHEKSIVRPYLLVPDIEAAVAAARAAGAEIAMPATPIQGQDGKFAIYILGGVQHALWQR